VGVQLKVSKGHGTRQAAGWSGMFSEERQMPHVPCLQRVTCLHAMDADVCIPAQSDLPEAAGACAPRYLLCSCAARQCSMPRAKNHPEASGSSCCAHFRQSRCQNKWWPVVACHAAHVLARRGRGLHPVSWILDTTSRVLGPAPCSITSYLSSTRAAAPTSTINTRMTAALAALFVNV
jgi:hypothetical protein